MGVVLLAVVNLARKVVMRCAMFTCLFLTPVLMFGWCAARPGRAQEFRMETDVFVEDAKEPVGETLTIFSNGLVYDFLLTGIEEITLFDRKRSRLVLMDTQRKVKTVLTMEDIVTFVANMKAQLSDDQRGYLVSEANSAVIEEDGWLKVATERVVYRAECIKPRDKSTALEYQEFADWYARLNAMRGSFPPFLRIHLNSEIAKRGLIPKTIERTVHDDNILTGRKQVVRSHHLANWRLSKTDRKRIDTAGTYLTTYPTVTLREYLRLPMASSDNGNQRH